VRLDILDRGSGDEEGDAGIISKIKGKQKKSGKVKRKNFLPSPSFKSIDANF